MKFYGLLLASTLLASSLFAQNTLPENGNVGIDTEGTPQAPLHVRQGNTLGGTLNDSELILRLQGESTNNFYQSIWMRRDEQNGNSWNTTRMHDGISIDNSFLSPGINTKTWWERDPYNNIQSWGTGNDAYMTLKSNSLGIGTDNPQRPLHVEGDDILLKNSSGTSLHLRTDGTSSYINNINNFVGNGSSGNNHLIITGQKKILLRTGNVGASGTDRIVIEENGNVGIGVGPSEKFDVNGNIRLRGDNGTIKFYRSTNAIDIANISYNNQESSFSFSANNKDLVFKSQLGFTESMRIKSNGNVGIGTETPSNKLDVNGTIHAKEVVVDLNFPGPDYVFEEDYPLQDLNSLEEYLKENKHLPEVPSAAQMEKEGVNMVEMQMLLLKKVEELTLHIIKQQEEINQLKKSINK